MPAALCGVQVAAFSLRFVMTTLDQDPGLSQLYQSQATGEPPLALDRRILAAARNAAQPIEPVPSATGWWPRWRLPLSVAATVALSASLVLLLERQPSETVVESSDQIVARAPSAAETVAAPSAPIEPTVTASAEAAKQKTEPVAKDDKPALTASLSDLPPLPEPPAATKPDSKPLEKKADTAGNVVAKKQETAKPKLDSDVPAKKSATEAPEKKESVKPVVSVAPAAVKPAPPAGGTSSKSVEKVAEKKEASKPAVSAAAEVVKPAPSAGGTSSKSAEKAVDKKEPSKPAENRADKAAAQKARPESDPSSDDFEIKAVEHSAAEPPPESFDTTDGSGIAVVQTASVWLEDIRALFKAGKSDRAKRQLKEFRAAYPDVMIPYDLTEKK